MAVPVLPVQRPPLGLPPGSVRAILALVLCGSLWYQVLRGEIPTTVLVDSSLLVVAFYFGVRSTAPVSVPVIPTAVPAKQPLHLPRGSVRTVLLLGFFLVIAAAWFRDRSLAQELVLILQVLASYLVGVGIGAVVERRRQVGKGPSLAVAVFRNLNALAALGFTVYMCGTIVAGWTPYYPQYTQNALAWVVAYYFGSRVAP